MQLACSQCNRGVTSGVEFCPWCGAALVVDVGRLTPGILIHGRYRIGELIRRGQYAALYRAQDDQGGRCLIKEMSVRGQPQAAARAEAAGATLLSLKHPNLPRFRDFFRDPASGRYYLVLDGVGGQSLEEMVADQGPFSEGQVRGWTAQLCDLLDYLHGQPQPVLVGAIDPGAIVLGRNGLLKLVDIGPPRIGPGGHGEPPYVPPERGRLDPRSDIYSLGVTLWRLATGHDPAAYPNGLAPVRHLAPTISPALEAVIQRAVQPKPADRFPSAGALQAALDGPSTAGAQATHPAAAPVATPAGSAELVASGRAWRLAIALDRRRVRGGCLDHPAGRRWLLAGGSGIDWRRSDPDSFSNSRRVY